MGIVVTGSVFRVRPRDGGGWRLRLVDTGGALAAAEITPAFPLLPPRPGQRILLRGRVRYDEEHRWYTVDPVETWSEASAADIAGADERPRAHQH